MCTQVQRLTTWQDQVTCGSCNKVLGLAVGGLDIACTEEGGMMKVHMYLHDLHIGRVGTSMKLGNPDTVGQNCSASGL